MKAPVRLLFSVLIPVMVLAEDSAYHCTMGDYDFKGTSYSDNYKAPGTEGRESCTQRDAMDSEKIGSAYKENRRKIELQIEKILNDPECVPLKPIILDYQEKYKKNQDIFDNLTKIRTEFVADKIKEYDVQKAYAYAGAFNGTCSGGQNRKTSFVNLEFINKLPQEGTSIQVTKDGEDVQSCADVTAGGSDDLKSFKVSTKKAQGKDFLFTWDPYGVPDHVIVKSFSGQVLYDSGCKGALETPPPVSLPVPKDGIVVNVINTCENPSVKASAWSLRIQCMEPKNEICKAPRDELIRLVTEEVNQTKTLIDANKLQQQCYFYIDKDILVDLLSDGMIGAETGPMQNGLCDVLDEECWARVTAEATGDKYGRKNATNASGPSSKIVPYREPSQEQFSCPERQDVEDSLFKTVSYAYCKFGWKKLGLEENIPE